MSLVVSEDEFAVLTVLISVWVNDSAPSLGTHYRVWKGAGHREKNVACKSRMEKKNFFKCSPNVFIQPFFSLGLTLNPLSPPHFFYFHKSLLLPPHIFKSGLMLRGAELISHMV